MSLKRRTPPIFFLKPWTSSRPSLTPPSICCSHYSHFSRWSNNEGSNLFSSRDSWAKHERRANVANVATFWAFLYNRPIRPLLPVPAVTQCAAACHWGRSRVLFPRATERHLTPKTQSNRISSAVHLRSESGVHVELVYDLKRVYKCYVSLSSDDMGDIDIN